MPVILALGRQTGLPQSQAILGYTVALSKKEEALRDGSALGTKAWGPKFCSHDGFKGEERRLEKGSRVGAS